MSDELDTTVEQPVAEETQEQSSSSETPTVSEDVKPQEEPAKRGDLNAALAEERRQRQELAARMSDPDFIYEQARKLGLTAEEAEQQSAQVTAPQQSGYSQYKYFSEIDKSQEKYPQLKTDVEDQVAITALMSTFNLSPLAAADRYYAKLAQKVDEARVEGAKAKEATITEKELAQTVVSTTATDSESAEYEDIVRRSRDQRNPREAERAHLELIKWKEAHRNK